MQMINAVDGCIPSDMATGSLEEIKEERRLLYVAMTRAKHHLQVIVPQRFYVTQQRGAGDRHLYAGRTRFNDDETAKLFEQRVWPQRAPAPQTSTAQAQPVMQVRRRAGAVWR